jgi:hypothetical protein
MRFVHFGHAKKTVPWHSTGPGLRKGRRLGHVAGMYKIIGADQKEYGPVSAEQLRQWIAEGRANAHSKVQPAGTTDWILLGDLPEFAGLLPKMAPPLPPGALTLPPAQKRTNQMAVWALVTGIFSLLCCQLLGPVSVVLGAVALTHLKQHPEEGGSGFAISGIVLGALAILLGIIAVVLLMSSPQLIQNFQNSLQQQ